MQLRNCVFSPSHDAQLLHIYSRVEGILFFSTTTRTMGKPSSMEKLQRIYTKRLARFLAMMAAFLPLIDRCDGYDLAVLEYDS